MNRRELLRGDRHLRNAAAVVRPGEDPGWAHAGRGWEKWRMIDSMAATEAEQVVRHQLSVPAPSLVLLVGVSGSGKSTFAARHFARTEVLSSDFFRGMIADDENDQRASADAFDVLYAAARKRLAAGRLTVIDATNVNPDARAEALELARDADLPAVAIVLDLPLPVCLDRNADRPGRVVDPQVVYRQRDALRRGMRHLAGEGFAAVHRLTSPGEVHGARVVRTPLEPDLRHEHGPFDIIGDVHGCLTELVALLARLGYLLHTDDQGWPVGAWHPQRRRAIFVGDLVDRGPDTAGVLRLAMSMVAAGDALAVPGNHEHKLLDALRGQGAPVCEDVAGSLLQLDGEAPEFRAAVERFLAGLAPHYVLDGGNLVVAHAGLPERLHGRVSERVRHICLYGQTTGEMDAEGLPVRYPWAREYHGKATVAYGHTPVGTPHIVNHTYCLDTGCVFGGHLTALRYPERELVSVRAARVYHPSVRPFPVNPQLERVSGS